MSSLAAHQIQAVEEWFAENFTLRGELGASVSVWQDGEEALSLSHGWRTKERNTPFLPETLVPVWSATKGPAALTCLMALHEARLPLDSPVAEVWPGFFQHGKDQTTFAHLLSHCAGLPLLDDRPPILDYPAVVKALESQRPLWESGRTQAYHARTFGFLLDEIVRNITGADSLGHYFNDAIAEPLGLEFWIGLPEPLHGHVATLYPGKISLNPQDQPFLQAFGTGGSITQRTFTSPVGLNAVQDFNRPETWAANYASMGGVGSARGLGKLYAILANGGKCQGSQFFPSWIMNALQKPLSQAVDAVLCAPIAFSAGMMMDPVDPETGKKMRRLFGPGHSAYGHPGAGGSHAFADPDRGLAFCYVMNQMETGILPGPKVQGLIDALD